MATDIDRGHQLHWRDWLQIGEFVVILVTAIFVWFQLRDAHTQIHTSSVAASEQLAEAFNRDLSGSANTGIIAAIDEARPIRKVNRGSFTDFQLDNYLGLYEVMDGAYTNGAMSDDDLCQFAFFLDEAGRSPEVSTYIEQQRHLYNSTDTYTGFQDLVGLSRVKCK